MIKYHVRSRDLITVVNDINMGRLILDAYFQRNLVWREVHKQDFIKTILLGFPCPQIFISKGVIDVENMATTSCVVDGQQRLNAISEYIAGVFPVDGSTYQELSSDAKSEFLKYELAVIELDLDNNDGRVKEIFQRLNRTSNSLTAIEKLASQYAPSQYMLVASHLAGELGSIMTTRRKTSSESIRRWISRSLTGRRHIRRRTSIDCTTSTAFLKRTRFQGKCI